MKKVLVLLMVAALACSRSAVEEETTNITDTAATDTSATVVSDTLRRGPPTHR